MAQLLFQEPDDRTQPLSRARFVHPADEAQEHVAMGDGRGDRDSPRPRVLRLIKAADSSQSVPMPAAVRYRVSMPRPHSHLFEVEAQFPGVGELLTVSLPVWTPGSYLVREFSRHLQDLRASGPQGEPLPLRRQDKRTFQIATGGKPVLLQYRVYANELSVRTSQLDVNHVFFNGATWFLYFEARRDAEHPVRVDPPPSWNTFSGLRR